MALRNGLVGVGGVEDGWGHPSQQHLNVPRLGARRLVSGIEASENYTLLRYSLSAGIATFWFKVNGPCLRTLGYALADSALGANLDVRKG